MNPSAALTVAIHPAIAIVAVGDPGRTRTVQASILFLVAIGVGLVALAAWLIRSTRVDPEVLAPLEVMGERSWRRADPVWQRRRLDEVRPEGAEPLDPTIPPPATDAEFDRGPRSTGFDDFDDLLRRFGVDLDDAAASDPAPVEQAPTAEPPVDETAASDDTVDRPDAADETAADETAAVPDAAADRRDAVPDDALDAEEQGTIEEPEIAEEQETVEERTVDAHETVDADEGLDAHETVDAHDRS